MEQEEMRRKELARFQFQSIGNLIDPHFIFNILNSIGSIVLKEEKEKAYDYFTKFTRLIRSALDYFTCGGVVKLWNGAGEGRVHSRPCAPSQTWSVAFTVALPRDVLMTL